MSHAPSVILSALCAALLSACGGSDLRDPLTGLNLSDPIETITGGSEAQQVKKLMQDWYLWYRDMPDKDVSRMDTAEEALEALRVKPIDRYSYVDTAEAFDRLFSEGRSIGVGVTYRVDGEQIRVRLVQPKSPAAAADLQRGDRLLSINGRDAAELVRSNTISDAFGPATAGVKVDFVVERGGQTRQVSVVKADYPLSSIIASGSFDAAGSPVAAVADTSTKAPAPAVGYLNLNTFISQTQAEWEAALAPMLSAGVRRIVVDLRDNGGGLLNTSAAIAASLAPKAASGAVFSSLHYNDKRRKQDEDITLPAIALSGSIDRVVFITSAQTCSASESLINGLKPYMQVQTVGETSCGKPVGFNPFRVRSKVISFVTFSATNRDGQGDYYNGMTPDCATGPDPLAPWGSPQDPKLAAALRIVNGGACPPIAAGNTPVPASTKAAAGLPATARSAANFPYPGRRGTSLWNGLD